MAVVVQKHELRAAVDAVRVDRIRRNDVVEEAVVVVEHELLLELGSFGRVEIFDGLERARIGVASERVHFVAFGGSRVDGAHGLLEALFVFAADENRVPVVQLFDVLADVRVEGLEELAELGKVHVGVFEDGGELVRVGGLVVVAHVEVSVASGGGGGGGAVVLATLAHGVLLVQEERGGAVFAAVHRLECGDA